MDKDVLIFLSGLQYAQTEEGEAEPLQVIAPGEHYIKNGTHFLLYDDAEMSGVDQGKNIIKFRQDHLEVIKNGSISTKLVFEKDKKTLSHYNTPFGGMVIGVSTRSVDLKEEEDEINIIAKYAMDVNNTFIADCKVEITAKPRSADFKLS